MKNFDIALYGNLVFDNIYEGFNHKTSVGGIGNVWNQLKLISPERSVHLAPTDIGESIILSDAQQCKRTSISHLSLKRQVPTVVDSKISHIAYLNEISDLRFLYNLQGLVTADICNGKKLNYKDPVLKEIDLLFVSDEDMSVADIEYLDGIDIIRHGSWGSDYYTKGKIYHQVAEFVPGINVLGAGDKFAALVILGILDSDTLSPKIMQHAHAALTEYYKNEKV